MTLYSFQRDVRLQVMAALLSRIDALRVSLDHLPVGARGDEVRQQIHLCDWALKSLDKVRTPMPAQEEKKP